MKKKYCTICYGQLGNELFSLANLPLVESFVKTEEQSRNILRESIRIHRCNNCSTVQILDPIDTSTIYKEYNSSPDLDQHFSIYAKSIFKKFNTLDNVLEIGGNDGLFLEKLNKFNFNNLTLIDPSPLSKSITIKGATVINDFLTSETISKYSLNHKSFDLIFANNCFSHITDFKKILKILNLLLSDNGTIIVEVQSMLSMFENVIFDLIYHEHIYYHTLYSFKKVCELAGLKIHDVEFIETKGGSYRFFISKTISDKTESSAIDFWLYRESLLNINSDHIWFLLNQYLETSKNLIINELKKYKKIFAYGASSTGTVLIDFYGLEKMIEYIVDDNPLRNGLYSPGACIPITNGIEINDSSDLCIILAWRHKEKILNKLKNYKGSILIPLPFMKIIKND